MGGEIVDLELDVPLFVEINDVVGAIRAAVFLVECEGAVRYVDISLHSTILTFDRDAMW